MRGKLVPDFPEVVFLMGLGTGDREEQKAILDSL